MVRSVVITPRPTPTRMEWKTMPVSDGTTHVCVCHASISQSINQSPHTPTQPTHAPTDLHHHRRQHRPPGGLERRHDMAGLLVVIAMPRPHHRRVPLRAPRRERGQQALVVVVAGARPPHPRCRRVVRVDEAGGAGGRVAQRAVPCAVVGEVDARGGRGVGVGVGGGGGVFVFVVVVGMVAVAARGFGGARRPAPACVLFSLGETSVTGRVGG